MAKKTPAKKSTKKAVKKVMAEAAVLVARDKYRSGPKFPKARTAGR